CRDQTSLSSPAERPSTSSGSGSLRERDRLRRASVSVSGKLWPLLEVFFQLGVVEGRPAVAAGEFALKRVVVRVRAEVLQLAGNLGVLCFLTAAPHGLTPLRFLPGGRVGGPGVDQQGSSKSNFLL